MIKLLVPKLPSTESLVPYLRGIEERRWATNWGELVMKLEARLSRRYDGAQVVTVSSCTTGLELVYMAMRHTFPANRVIVPALTFPASALAPLRAGLSVGLCDVDPDTWISPFVAGFGLPATGSIVDAAGAFGEQKVSHGQIVVFSMHATKVLTAGEGGYIVCSDPDIAAELREMSNFGLRHGKSYGMGESWVSQGLGTNAKLSEYHAAVALASLDAWDREPWIRLFDWYAQYLPAEVVPQKRPRGVYPIMAVKLPCGVQPVMKLMAECGIETRRWYYPTLDKHPLFLSGTLPVTEDLSRRLIGLPWHLWLTEDDVRVVCAALHQSIITLGG